MTLNAEQIQKRISDFLAIANIQTKSPQDFNNFLTQLTEDTKKLDEPSLQSLINALKAQSKNQEDSISFLAAIANGLHLEDKILTPAILNHIIESFDETTYQTLLKKLLTSELANTRGGTTELRDKAVSTALMSANFERYKMNLETILNDFILKFPGFAEISEKSYLPGRTPQLNAQGQSLLFSCIQGLLARLSAESTDGALYQISLHSQEIFKTLQQLNHTKNPEEFNKYIAGEVIVRRIGPLLLAMTNTELQNGLTLHQKLFIKKLCLALNNLSNFIDKENQFRVETPCGEFYTSLYKGKLPLQGHHDVINVCQYFHSKNLSQFKIFLLNTMAKSNINIAPEQITMPLKLESELTLQNKINALYELTITLMSLSEKSKEIHGLMHVLNSTFLLMSVLSDNEKKCLTITTLSDFKKNLLPFLESKVLKNSEKSPFTEDNDHDRDIRKIICVVLELGIVDCEGLKPYKDAACKGFEEMADLSRKQRIFEAALSNPKSDIWKIYHTSQSNGIFEKASTPCLRSGNRKLYRALCHLLILNPFYNVPEEEISHTRTLSRGIIDTYRKSTGAGTPSPILKIPQTLEDAKELIAENSTSICALTPNEEGKINDNELRMLLDHRANLFLSYNKFLSSQTSKQQSDDGKKEGKVEVSTSSKTGKEEVPTPSLVPQQPAVASSSASLSEGISGGAKPTTPFPSVATSKGSEAKPVSPRSPRPASTYQGLPTLPTLPDTPPAPTTIPVRERRPASKGKISPDNLKTSNPAANPTEVSVIPTIAAPAETPSTDVSLSTNPHGTFSATRTARRLNVSEGKITQPFFAQMVAEKPNVMLPNRFYIWRLGDNTYAYSFKTKEGQDSAIFAAEEISDIAGRISVAEQFSALSEGEKNSFQGLIKTKYFQQGVTLPDNRVIFAPPNEQRTAPVLSLS